MPAQPHARPLVPRPLEIASEETQKLLNDLGRGMLPRLHTLGYQSAQHAGETPEAFLEHAFALGLDAAWVFDSKDKFVKGGVVATTSRKTAPTTSAASAANKALCKTLCQRRRNLAIQNKSYFASHVPVTLSGSEQGTSSPHFARALIS